MGAANFSRDIGIDTNQRKAEVGKFKFNSNADDTADGSCNGGDAADGGGSGTASCKDNKSDH